MSEEIIVLCADIQEGIVTSNLPEFRAFTRAWLDGINSDLQTDEQFGQAEMDVKTMKGAEDRIKAVKDEALSKAVAINALLTGLDDASGEIAEARLKLEKKINARKDEIKSELINEALGKIECAPRHRERVFGKSITEAIKGKRTQETMKKALDVVVACHNALIRKSKAMLDAHVVEHGLTLVMDRLDLEVKSPDFVEGELQRRVDAHKAEQDRIRLVAEAAKARAEAADANRRADAREANVQHPEARSEARPPVDEATKGMPPLLKRMLADGPDTSAEFDEIKAVVFAAFSSIKEARAKLTFTRNVEAMDAFAAACSEGWKAAVKHARG